MVSQLIFKYFIHFEFTQVYGEVDGLVSFFACNSPVLPTPFIEETIFTPF